MGTARTAQLRISRLRETFRKSKELGKPLIRKKLEAQIVLSGSTPRHAREIVQTFIDADELIEFLEEGVKMLKVNPDYYE